MEIEGKKNGEEGKKKRCEFEFPFRTSVNKRRRRNLSRFGATKSKGRSVELSPRDGTGRSRKISFETSILENCFRACVHARAVGLNATVLQAVMQFCFSELSYAPAALCVHGTVPCTHYWFSLVTAYRVYRAPLLHVTAILRIIVFENTGQVRFRL